MSFEAVNNFWFKKLTIKDHFSKNPELDNTIRSKFIKLYEKAIAGELSSWRDNPYGRLAEVIILDQFTRNMFRDQADAFKYDFLALCLAQEAVRCGDDQKIDISMRSFMYMPFMHSESKLVHEQTLVLFSQKGLEGNLDFELRHKKIIDRFGRYPHRNKILSRASTQEELEFLNEVGSSF